MIFDVVRSVMTILDDQGAADHDDWEDLLAERLASLEASYAELLKVDRELIDYSDLATQTAYVFRYVIGHAEYICQLLTMARQDTGAPLFETDELWVTSVGGGPGSELLGLVKYLAQAKTKEPEIKKIVYTVVDKENNWRHVIDLVIDAIETDIEIDVYYRTFDVTEEKIPDNVTLKHEELVFMSFFISEVCRLPDAKNVRKNVTAILDSMPSNSLLLYNDSRAYSFHSFFDARVAAAKGFDEVVSFDQELKVKSPDFSGLIGEFIEKYDYRPRLSSNAISKLMRRSVK
jgi:Protein of unknown function (DUF3115).